MKYSMLWFFLSAVFITKVYSEYTDDLFKRLGNNETEYHKTIVIFNSAVEFFPRKGIAVLTSTFDNYIRNAKNSRKYMDIDAELSQSLATIKTKSACNSTAYIDEYRVYDRTESEIKRCLDKQSKILESKSSLARMVQRSLLLRMNKVQDCYEKSSSSWRDCFNKNHEDIKEYITKSTYLLAGSNDFINSLKLNFGDCSMESYVNYTKTLAMINIKLQDCLKNN